ncbi:unnamed protein product, partial [Gongylonema pulchrum]|uniref:Neuron navigator 2 n=1 Tax=Gongylonema pulchrum TaxID=637853 RepID=A0A183DK25_9BILA
VNGGTKPSKKNIHIFHDSLSTITEESSEGSCRHSTSLASNLSRAALAPLSTKNSPMKKLAGSNGENLSTTIPVGVVAPQRSTSPLIVPDGATEKSDSGKSKYNFTSNALRL